MPSGRGFLCIGLCTFTIFHVCCHAATTASFTTPKSRRADVIVVGGGISGLAAAGELATKFGLRVTVLEARDRLGGRLWTDRTWPEACVDLGASWIQGYNEDNEITRIQQKYKIEVGKTEGDNTWQFDSAAKLMTDEQVEANEGAWAVALEALGGEAESRQAAGLPDISIGEAIKTLGEKNGVSAEQMQAVDFQANMQEHELATSVYNMSLFSTNSEKALEGGMYVFPQGYDQIWKAYWDDVMSNLPANNTPQVLTSRTVTSVDYSSHNGDIQVTTKENGTFGARAVIVTVPLGILKNGNITFTPALPKNKQDAIDRLGMGVLNKLYLKFPKVFWSADGKEPDTILYMNPNRGQFTEMINFHPAQKVPVIMLFNAEPYGAEIEKMDNAIIVANGVEVLRTIFGKENVPEPEGAIMTRWRSDPYTYGSYSYYAVGSTPADREYLAQEIGNRKIYFAGEATRKDFPATVHGAFKSGISAANKLCDQKKKLCKRRYRP